MRVIVVALMGTVLLAALAIGQETKAPKKAQPTDLEVIGLVGSRLAKVFAKFGEPNNIFPANVASDEPTVCLDYGPFGFSVYKKTIQNCMFWPSWTGTACGIKLGSTGEEIEKTLGKPLDPERNGPDNMFWRYKANGEVMTLHVGLNKDKKCTRVTLKAN